MVSRLSCSLRCIRMSDLHVKVCHGVRRRLRPIQSRAVTLCKSDWFEIDVRWNYILFQPQCELRAKFFVFQCSHEARREVDLPLSRCVESIVYQIDPGSFFRVSLRDTNRFRMHSARYLSSSMLNSESTEFWERSHTYGSAPHSPC